MRRITSTCKKCILQKKEASRLPCLALYALWSKGQRPRVKDVLCKVGPFDWCPRFCGLPDRIIEGKLKQFLSEDVVNELTLQYTLKGFT